MGGDYRLDRSPRGDHLGYVSSGGVIGCECSARESSRTLSAYQRRDLACRVRARHVRVTRGVTTLLHRSAGVRWVVPCLLSTHARITYICASGMVALDLVQPIEYVRWAMPCLLSTQRVRVHGLRTYVPAV